jgi:hypothetical protein
LNWQLMNFTTDAEMTSITWQTSVPGLVSPDWSNASSSNSVVSDPPLMRKRTLSTLSIEGVWVRAIFTDEARACRKKHRTTTRSQARIDRSLDVGPVIRDAITLGAKCRIFHIEID